MVTVTNALDTITAVKALLTTYLPSYLTAVGITAGLVSGTGSPDELLIQMDEYQPLQSRYQIVIKEGPLRTVFLAPEVFRMEQSEMIEVHIRPVRYDAVTMDAQRLIFENLKKAIQQIFSIYRYDSLFSDITVDTNPCSGYTDVNQYASTIEMRGWANDPIPRGLGRQKEPLEFVARMTINVIYYQADGSPVSNVGTRVVSISVISQTLGGLVDADWEDMDQWVQIKIPAGPVIEQNLIGTHIDGTITCRDWRSISNCFMKTAISDNAGHYPINSDGSKTKFSTTSNEFSITIRDSSGYHLFAVIDPLYVGTKLLVFWFTNVRIKQIKQVKSSTQGGVGEPMWQILFMADGYVQPTLN